MRLKRLLLIVVALTWHALTLHAQSLTVTSSEPRDVDNAIASTLSISGSGFTAQTLVRLVGYGFLTPTLLSSTALTAAIPPGVPAGIYEIEVSDPTNGTAISPVRLIVIQQVTPFPIPTQPAPTPLVGQPSLSVRGVTLTPSQPSAGGSLSASLEVVNTGNLPALGVTLSVDAGGKFVQAGGAAVSVPDLFPGAAARVTLNLTAAADTPAGANFIPLTLNYRDPEGKPLSSKASLSVIVEASASAPLISLLTYSTTPEVVQPGQIAVIRAHVQNTGTRAANQVVIRLATATEPVLIAGPRGDTFPVGDIQPGSTAIIDLPVFVAQNAKAGVQPQGLVLTHVVNGSVVEQPTSLAVNVAAVVRPRPIFLLEEVVVSTDEVKPGDQFNLSFRLHNVGNAPAESLLVAFGSVESTGGTGGGSDPSGGGTSGDGGTTTTVRSSTQFAPVGTGAAQFIERISEDSWVRLSQDFIASAALESGVYLLPITLRYVREDGSTATESFSATVVVVGLPKLQVSFDSPLPEQAEVGSPVPLAVTFTNRAAKALMVDRIAVVGEGIDVVEGASTPVGQLKTDEQASVNAVIVPNAEGEFSVTFNVHYIDDLNRPQVFPLTYRSAATAPPEPPPFPEEPPPFEPPPPPPPPPDNLLTKLLLGFLGLGE
ncbi:hypothetical protein VZO05_15985 (plasmid) [Aggregatilineales bacterium SYSU G02658]